MLAIVLSASTIFAQGKERKSPAKTASAKIVGSDITVSYSSPSVK